jgi:hypothetical protein
LRSGARLSKSQLTRKSQMLRELTRTRNAVDTVGPGEGS